MVAKFSAPSWRCWITKPVSTPELSDHSRCTIEPWETIMRPVGGFGTCSFPWSSGGDSGGSIPQPTMMQNARHRFFPCILDDPFFLLFSLDCRFGPAHLRANADESQA